MADTAARMLALLGLLQARSDWSGTELADRLDVTDRTIRNDVDRLRGLGYPVDAVRGPGGRYRLGTGTKLPPLLLDEDEAVAVAIGLRAGTTVQGIEETSARALAKLQHVLPHRLQRRVNALKDAVSTGPENTGSNVEDPVVDPSLLAEVAAAVRDHVELRFDYRAPQRTSRLQLEPYRLVSWQRRWFVVARDAGTDSWAPYRLDWMRLRTPGGRRFTPHPLPGGDYTSFVLREVAFSGWSVHARIAVDAPAEEVLARINPTVGVVESVDADHCVLVTGGDSVEIIAAYIGMLGLDFHVADPPELVDAIAALGERYRRAVPVTPTSGTPAPGPSPGSRSPR
ncbi:MAG TPA: WYL domain-containing protein [Nocardioides sp.]|nr:WYL domain-containing protein [Nocardioides sp.]